jgi:hypothetical protein
MNRVTISCNCIGAAPARMSPQRIWSLFPGTGPPFKPSIATWPSRNPISLGLAPTVRAVPGLTIGIGLADVVYRNRSEPAPLVDPAQLFSRNMTELAR